MPKSTILTATQDPRSADVAKAIASVCRIDDDFPADRNLTEALIDAVEAPHWQSHLPEQRQRWSEALRNIKGAGDRKGWRRAEAVTQRGTANPLAGRLSKYPVAAFLLQRAHPQVRTQAVQLRNLYFAALLENPSSCTVESADQLRISIAPKSERRHFLARFPASKSSYPANLQALEKHLIDTLNDPSFRVSESESQLAHQVLTLINTVATSRARTARAGRGKGTVGTSKPRRRVPSCPADRGEKPPAGTKVLTRRASRPDPHTIEPPDEAYAALTVDLPQEDQADPELPQAVADVVARQTRHWITRHQRLVPNDTTRLTPLERRQLVGNLLAGLEEPVPLVSDASALLLLVYTTGSVLEAVLNFQIGPSGDLREDGFLRRQIKIADDAYRPGPELTAALEPIAEELLLPLPQPLARWLESKGLREETELSSCLGHSRAELVAEVRGRLRQARESGRFNRLRLERIAAALPLEISLETQDPVALHHVAGKPGDAPPVLAYYVPHYVEYLVALYRSMTARMLEQS